MANIGKISSQIPKLQIFRIPFALVFAVFTVTDV
jgi:hypothetical protein